ncbi:MAG: HAD hydrolase-like protein [Clostridia bacterium]|nr:HAD hydrolase-like protein [Clostridia bacterium]
MIKNVFFDLDGTLTDSKEGIIKSAQYAFEKLGLPVPAFEEMYWVMGPPIRTSFRERIHLSEEDAFRGLRYYQERFGSVGYLENRVYEGVEQMLGELKDLGYRLFITTSKPTFYTNEILKHFGLDRYFTYVSGSDMDGTHGSKAEVVRYVIENFDCEKDETVIVGDRDHDILGGIQNGIHTIGVRYGYASENELEDAGAQYIAESPEDIITKIRSF